MADDAFDAHGTTATAEGVPDPSLSPLEVVGQSEAEPVLTEVEAAQDAINPDEIDAGAFEEKGSFFETWGRVIAVSERTAFLKKIAQVKKMAQAAKQRQVAFYMEMLERWVIHRFDKVEIDPEFMKPPTDEELAEMQAEEAALTGKAEEGTTDGTGTDEPAGAAE